MNHPFWQTRSVFVTGATGLIGSWLTKSLVANGARVIALVRDLDPHSELVRSGVYRQITIVHGVVEDYSLLDRLIGKFGVDSVFHLAAQTIVGAAQRSPLQTFEVNIRGTYNLLDACRVHQDSVARVVVASSDKAYGAQRVLPYTENMPLMGKQPYEISKTCTDILSQSYHECYGLPVAVARCGNVYGGGDLNWSRIVPYTIRCCLKGESPIIRSDGTPLRDYIYVKDAVRAYLYLGQAVARQMDGGYAYNFGPHNPTSVVDLVQRLQERMGCGHLVPQILGTAIGEIQAQYLDSSKAKADLDWYPTYDLDEGISETIRWYRQLFDSTESPDMTDWDA